MVVESFLTPVQIDEAVKAFRAEKCPFCSGDKLHRNDPFCEGCQERLTPELFHGVADWSTFLDTFHKAMTFLKKNQLSGTHINERGPSFQSLSPKNANDEGI